MAKFALYNYQFVKLNIENPHDFYGEHSIIPSSDETFPKRQEILNKILADDYKNIESISFTSKNEIKEYGHIHFMKPHDGLFIIKLQNKKLKTHNTIDFHSKQYDDYPCVSIIIDNSIGIQRLAIEAKIDVFGRIDRIEEFILKAINKTIKRYNLALQLFALNDSKSFWAVAADGIRYPKGFRKMVIHFPHLNLERLEEMEREYSIPRRSFNSSMDVVFASQQNDKLKIDPEDKYQSTLIDYATNHLGGKKTIRLYPADKQPSFYYGENKYTYVQVSTTDLDMISKADLFDENPALKNVKKVMEQNIEIRKNESSK